MLLQIYREHEIKFTDVNYTKKKVWKLIADNMATVLVFKDEHVVPTPLQCENRWKTMTSMFRKTHDHNNISGKERRTCPYYDEMMELYGYRPNVEPVATCSSTGSGDRVRNLKRVNNEAEDDEPSSSGPPQKKKRNYTTSSEASSNALLSWLEKQNKKREENESKKLELLERMHNEKMAMMERLIDSFQR